MLIFVKDSHNITVGLDKLRADFEKKHGLRLSNGDLLAMLVKQEAGKIKPKAYHYHHEEDYSQMGPDHV